jgi:nitrogen fixation/metabolism regulation signal transduction histidine kinase
MARAARPLADRTAGPTRLLLTVHLLGLHGALVVAAWVLWREAPWAFVAAEAAIVLSAGLAWRLMRRAWQPVEAARRFRHLLQDGHYAARLAPTGHREADELVALFNRLLTELHDERLRLGEQRGFLDKLLEATPSAVVVFDFDGRVSLRNATAVTLLGEPGTGPVWPQLQSLSAGDRRLLTDPQGRRLRAQRGQFVDRGFTRDFLLVQELTEELERSERATYDKLVRVLAHEVNNTVAATRSVLGSLGYYRDQLREEDRLDFATAVEAVQQRNASLGDFIERFTRVAKMPEPHREPLDPLGLLDSTARLYAATCADQGIVLEWTVREPGLVVDADRALLEQAVVNVLKNAIEAVLAARRDDPGHASCVRLAVGREGGSAHLSVSDSANGLVGTGAALLFTPFFTTKRGGSGLGLMFVREVLQRHGFAHRLAPTGRGETRFEMWMPLRSVGRADPVPMQIPAIQRDGSMDASQNPGAR